MREDSALRRSGAETFRLSATVSLATAEAQLEVTPGAESDLRTTTFVATKVRSTEFCNMMFESCAKWEESLETVETRMRVDCSYPGTLRRWQTLLCPVQRGSLLFSRVANKSTDGYPICLNNL